VVERRYGPNETIFAPGDPDDRLYFLLEGMVRTYKTYGNFKEATTALLKDRGTFGRPDLEGGSSQDDFAEAMSGATVAQVPKAAVARLARREPEVALALYSALAQRVRRSDELVATLLPREVKSRLAPLLLNLSERFGEEDEEGGAAIDPRLTHQDLANMIASTREAVSKVMSEFQRDGHIEVRDRRITIVDRDALTKYDSGLSGL
jgi:CRP/FNR family transcriptional regulator